MLWTEVKNMNYKAFYQKTAAYFKKKKYYIATSLCILTVGAVGVVSYLSAKTAWDDTPLPDSPQLDATDANVPKDDVTEESNEQEVSKPTKQQEEPKAKDYVLPLDGKIDVGYSVDRPVYSKTLADWRTHEGIDYIAPLGTAVKAINDGVVKSVTTDDLLGVTVVIKHTDGNESLYANLDKEVSVKVDQLVNQSDTIGKVGQSAIIEISQEPHLHFEVSCDGKTIDPLKLYDK